MLRHRPHWMRLLGQPGRTRAQHRLDGYKLPSVRWRLQATVFRYARRLPRMGSGRRMQHEYQIHTQCLPTLVQCVRSNGASRRPRRSSSLPHLAFARRVHDKSIHDAPELRRHLRYRRNRLRRHACRLHQLGQRGKVHIRRSFHAIVVRGIVWNLQDDHRGVRESSRQSR